MSNYRQYLPNQELLDIVDNWSDDDNQYDIDPSNTKKISETPLTIKTVVVGESDGELINDDEISTNIACDLSPLNKVAGTIEVVYESNVENYAGPVDVVEPQPSTSEYEPPQKKYRCQSDFKPNWKKTTRFKYDI